MSTSKVVVIPSDFNETQFDVTTGGKVNLLAAFLNPFFKDASLDTSTNPASPVYTFIRYDNTAVNLPAHVNDVHVTSVGSGFDSATSVLTLGFTAGGAAVTVNLAELSKTASQSSTSIAFSGDGTSGSKLSATVIVKANGGITSGADGLELDFAGVNAATHDVVLTDMAGNFIMSGGSLPTA